MQMKILINKNRKESGITLLALVVTIIVLLILAGITIGVITGDDGIINKAKESKKAAEIAQWEERIDSSIIDAENKYRDPTLEQVIDELYEDDIIDDKEKDVDRDTGAITTNEPEYVIEGKLDDYLDKKGTEEPEPEPDPELTPPDLVNSNTTFAYNPSTMTKKDVKVTITTTVGSGFTLQYSTNGTTWENYTKEVTMTENGAIYARLINNENKAGGYATGNVVNIDKLEPNSFTARVTNVTENSITISGSTTDKEATISYACSGIKGYQFSKDNGASWSTLQTGTSYTFNNLTAGTTYNFKMKAIDNAENETETQTLTQKTNESGIVAADIPATDYGAIVKGYDCTNSAAVNNWLLFYADDNNIYLIADDYILCDYAPSTSAGNKPQKGYWPKTINISPSNSNILKDYIAGSSNITDERIKALNNDYFTKGYSSRLNNMRVVAYLLDIQAWSGYAGKYADYAIGGPSIELLFNSYNKKYETNYKAEAYRSDGYKISINGGSSWIDSRNSMFSTTDPTYVISDIDDIETDSAYGMLIASPAYQAQYYYTLYYNGNLINLNPYTSDARGMGLRPVVCLKPDVKLQKNSDGSYTIIGSSSETEETLEKITILMPSSVTANYGETVRITASKAQSTYKYHVYKANSLTGNGEEVNHSRLSISISGTTLTFTITGMTESDEGYYYLVVETPEGLKQSSARTHLIFNGY